MRTDDAALVARASAGHPPVASARAAIHVLTSLLPESGRDLALFTILVGLYGAYRQTGERVPEWLDELFEDAK